MLTLAPQQFEIFLDEYYKQNGHPTYATLVATGKLRMSIFARAHRFVEEHRILLRQQIPKLSISQEQEILRGLIWLSAPRRLRRKYRPEMPIYQPPRGRPKVVV